MIVLDSSALLAMLFFEPGHERVADLVPESCMSTVNLAEVLGRLARDGRALAEALDRLEQMGIVWIEFDRELALGAAALLLPTAPFGLSLGTLPASRSPGCANFRRSPSTAPGRSSSRHTDRGRRLKARVARGRANPRTRRPPDAVFELIRLGSLSVPRKGLFRAAGNWRVAAESRSAAIGFAGIKEARRALRSVARC